MSLKNPVTPQGIDPGTVRLVAQCINGEKCRGFFCVCVMCIVVRLLENILIECLHMFHIPSHDNVFRIIATDLHYLATLFCFSNRNILSLSLQQIYSRSRVYCIFIYLLIYLFICGRHLVHRQCYSELI